MQACSEMAFSYPWGIRTSSAEQWHRKWLFGRTWAKWKFLRLLTTLQTLVSVYLSLSFSWVSHLQSQIAWVADFPFPACLPASSAFIYHWSSSPKLLPAPSLSFPSYNLWFKPPECKQKLVPIWFALLQLLRSLFFSRRQSYFILWNRAD